ncbi:hypothetical protein HOC54_04315, partial [Candidatus Peregrinibacteria bacterium]|nr:hypothetical protein [Candidatus Peregrinibacteria bacterium]
TCGDCPPGNNCQGFTCIPDMCIPDCDGKDCGNDGCGGSCGDCFPGSQCINSECVPDGCVPNCDDAECGDDGCGGSCGTCLQDQICYQGPCASNIRVYLQFYGYAYYWGPDGMVIVNVNMNDDGTPVPEVDYKKKSLYLEPFEQFPIGQAKIYIDVHGVDPTFGGKVEAYDADDILVFQDALGSSPPSSGPWMSECDISFADVHELKLGTFDLDTQLWEADYSDFFIAVLGCTSD